MVLAEVGGDDGHGQGHQQHARHGARRADDTARVGRGRDVAVADGGEGDDGPPQGQRQVPQRARLGDLGHVDEDGEAGAGRHRQHRQRQQLLAAVVQAQAQHAQLVRLEEEAVEPGWEGQCRW